MCVCAFLIPSTTSCFRVVVPWNNTQGTLPYIPTLPYLTTFLSHSHSLRLLFLPPPPSPTYYGTLPSTPSLHLILPSLHSRPQLAHLSPPPSFLQKKTSLLLGVIDSSLLPGGSSTLGQLPGRCALLNSGRVGRTM